MRFLKAAKSLLWVIALTALLWRSQGADATFWRAFNLNGPGLVIETHAWEGLGATNLTFKGKQFENQAVPLKPATDRNRARMIRSSVWGDKVEVEITAVPEGPYQVFLYVWEDTINEQFDILVNDQIVVEKFNSGTAGVWRKLGPWKCRSRDGKIKISAKAPGHGAANFSGIEIWAGEGPIPSPPPPAFVNTPTPEQTEFFERHIRPVLVEHCYECHSSGAKKLRGGLVLDSRAGIQKGGDTGPAITPGEPEASLLIQAIQHTDPEMAMPKKKLPPDVIAHFETWVRMGAPDPRSENTVALTQARSTIDWDKARQWWSFRPIQSVQPSKPSTSGWPFNPVDQFILGHLEEKGLSPAPDADKVTLIRRVTYDLTGLPPSPEEVRAFVEDITPEAYAKVVDRLLGSTRYGERWGRHWLDVARYADSAGDNSDFPIPQMHRYRDWVISAFNRDLPYDQFIREQLAGDLLPGATTDETHARLIATGYIANARRFGSRVDDYPQHLTIEDTLDNLGRAFLGLSLNCARCHDHKFDPIPTADYYALYGIFNSTRYPWPGIELEQRQRDLVPLVETGRLAEAEAQRRQFDEEKSRLEKAARKLKDALKEIPAEERKAHEARIAEAEAAVKAHVQRGLPFAEAYAVAESSRRGDVAIQIKGDPAKPGAVVARRFLTVLGGQTLPASDTSSGRLQLAAWIASRTNPLTARVMVNRIWLHHFGKGLVPTPNDFGRQGKPPSHAELLDWLAATFMDNGWSVKSMHRLILLSHTYRQSTLRDPKAVEQDPSNELLSSYPRRRLDAESIRDTLLWLGGNLDTTEPRPHPFPPESEWKFTQHNPFKAVYETRQRSVYLMTQRIQRHPYLAIFDGADPSASTPVRTSSTTPLQALFLLNDSFVHAQANDFAARLLQSERTSLARIERMYAYLFARMPEASELQQCLQFLGDVRDRLNSSGTSAVDVETESWRSLTRALLRANEFVYLE